MDNTDFFEELDESPLDDQGENEGVDDHDEEAKILVGDDKSLLVVV